MKLAALFPGQGSQVVGMGSDFCEKYELARDIFESADISLGFSLSKLCFDGPLELLTLTKNAQPAILTVSIIAYELLQGRFQAAAGHSLGEYSALVAAKSITLSDAIQLVHKRGTYMQEAVNPGEGKMVAIIGTDADEILSIIKNMSSELPEDSVVEIANLNCPGQTVVAGDNTGVDLFSKKMLQSGGKVIPLNVSAPFHCRLMAPAANNLAKDLDAIRFNDPIFPVYANFTAQKIESGNAARALLKSQVCGTVRWTELIQKLITDQLITHAVEFGPGGVLSKLMKRINKSVKTFDLSDTHGLEFAKSSLNTQQT